MVIAGNASYNVEVASQSGARPRVLLEIQLDAGSEYEGDLCPGRKITMVGQVARRLQKYGEAGASFAGQITVELDNTDKAFNRGGGGKYGEELRGKICILYQYFDLTDEASHFLSTSRYLSSSRYLATDSTPAVAQFTGLVEEYDTSSPDGKVVIVLRDALQPLALAKFSSDGSATGVAPTVIKDLIEANTSITVNADSYARALRFAAGMLVKVVWSEAGSVLAAIQDIHKVKGTACWTNEDGEVEISCNGIELGQYLTLIRRLSEEIFIYNHDASTRGTDFNVLATRAKYKLRKVINRVRLTFRNIDTGETETIKVDDAASQASPIGVQELTLSSNAYVSWHQAHAWPQRLVYLYKDALKPEMHITSSLKSGMRNQINDIIQLTDPGQSIDDELFRLLRVNKNLASLRTQIEAEKHPVERWAFAGTDSPESGYRRTDVPDFLWNKSFEVATNPGVDDIPLKWVLGSGAGGTFAVDPDEYRDGMIGLNSAHVVSAADSSEWRQTIVLNPFVDTTAYRLSVYVKGTVSVGTLRVGFRSSVGFYSPVAISGTYADWTRVSVGVTAGANLPYSAVVTLNGCTCDIYLDDIQIDYGSTPLVYEENVYKYAFACNPSGHANPFHDPWGNDDGTFDEDYLEGIEKPNVAW